MKKQLTAKKVPRELAEFFGGSNRKIKVGKSTLSLVWRVAYFPEYFGPPPKQTWQKPIVAPPKRPFAELQLVQRLEQDGWTAAWVYRPGKFIRAWEPRTPVRFPKAALEMLKRIQKRAGAKAGCWDIFAWKKGQPLFVEAKRRNSSDAIRQSQLKWREAALLEGIPQSAFELIEWCGGTLKGRVIRLTSIFGDKVDGWVECRNGQLIYGGPSPGTIEGILKHYEDWGTMTNADLLWLVFVRNQTGLTYCDFDEWPAGRH